MKAAILIARRKDMIVINKILPLFILLIFSLMIYSCSGSSFKDSDRAEGITGGKLRVAVKIQKNDEDANPENINNDTVVIEAARVRGKVLLTAYAESTIKHPPASRNMSQFISENLTGGKIIARECAGDICIFFVDFEAEAVIEKIGLESNK